MKLEERLQQEQDQLEALEEERNQLKSRKAALEDRIRSLDQEAAGLRYAAEFEGDSKAAKKLDEANVAADKARETLQGLEEDQAALYDRINEQSSRIANVETAIQNRDCVALRLRVLELKLKRAQLMQEVQEVNDELGPTQKRFETMNAVLVMSHRGPDRTIVGPISGRYADESSVYAIEKAKSELEKFEEE